MQTARSKKKVISTKNKRSQTNKRQSQVIQEEIDIGITIKKQRKNKFQQKDLLKTVTTKSPFHLNNYSNTRFSSPSLNLQISQNSCFLKKEASEIKINELFTKVESNSKNIKEIVSKVEQIICLRYNINKCSMKILQSLLEDQKYIQAYAEALEEVQNERKMVELINQIEEKIQAQYKNIAEIENKIQIKKFQYQRKQREIKYLSGQIKFKSIAISKLEAQIEKSKLKNNSIIIDKILLSFFQIHILYFQKTLTITPKQKKKIKDCYKFKIGNVACINNLKLSLDVFPFYIRLPLVMYLLAGLNKIENIKSNPISKISYFSFTMNQIFNISEFFQLYRDIVNKKRAIHHFDASFTKWSLKQCNQCSKKLPSNSLMNLEMMLNLLGITLVVQQQLQVSYCQLIFLKDT